MSVERAVTWDELSSGVLRLGQAQAQSLRMPEFSQSVAVRFHERVSHADWNARSRTLTGEELIEDLVLEVQGGDILRWSLDGDILVLETIKAWSSGSRIQVSSSFESDPFEHTPGDRPTLFSTSTGRPKGRNRSLDRTQRRARIESDFDWPRKHVGILRESLSDLNDSIAEGGWDDPDSFRLRVHGEKLSAINDFEELVAADGARIDPMEHQYAAALKALGVMRGRAILADEVGLGKTIEAGLVASELKVRGLASRFLIICPATLRDQWQAELKEKFGIAAEIITSGSDRIGDQSLIMSLHLARNRMSALHERDWDLVIVDEAHRLTGKTAHKTRDLITGLSTRYMLFLTATPVQNDLLELYRLVELLRPGTFPSQRHFERAYVNSGDPRRPRNPADLRRLVSNVMIRTTRAQAGLDTVSRIPQDVRIHMTATEQDSYELTVRILREVLTGPSDHLMRSQLAQQLSLSPQGLYESARRIAQSHPDPNAQQILRELAEVAMDHGPTSRQRALVDLVNEWISDPDKGRVLVFTQHTRVLTDLLGVLEDHGIEAAAYHGGMSASAKRDALEAFRGPVKVLVSTEAGAEGLNLQHANAVINYDLPWNPMRIEQRIGRVHRVTQTRNVHVANMFAVGTIDEHVYSILVDKLRMFELLFGQITTILGEMEDGSEKSGTFEGEIRQALVASSDAEMQRKLQQLAARAGTASERARTQLTDAGGVSSWMSPTLDHRVTIKAEATELRPAAAVRSRERQRAVEEFARDWLVLHGQHILHQTNDFIAAQIHDHLHEAMGADTVYLGFSPQGLREHPGAELVTVGSPIFQDMLKSAQQAGDLLAWTVDTTAVNDLQAYPAHESAPDCSLISRSCSPAESAGGTATWRIVDEASRFSDEVREISWGKPVVEKGVHTPVPGGTSPSELFALLGGKQQAFTKNVTRECLPQISAVQASWQNDVEAVFSEDRDRRLTRAKEELVQYDEQYWHSDLRDELEQSVSDIKSERAPKVRVHAELLAVEIVSQTTASIQEAWRRDDGLECVVNGTWDAKAKTITLLDLHGSPISTLGICDEGHAVDTDDLSSCPQCHNHACPGCSPARHPDQHCGVCNRSVCLTCLPADHRCVLCGRLACASCWDDGLCSTCVAPREVSEAEFLTLVPNFLQARGCAVRYGVDDHQRTFALRGGDRREVAIVDEQGSLVGWWTVAHDDPALLIRALTASSATADSGAVSIKITDKACPEGPSVAGPSVLIAARQDQEEAWFIGANPVSTPVAYAGEPAPVRATNADVIAAIDRALPVENPAGITVTVSTVHTATRTWVDAEGLARWTARGDEERLERDHWSAAGPETLNWISHRDPKGDGPIRRRIASLPGTVVMSMADSNDQSLTVATPAPELPLASWRIRDRTIKTTATMQAAGLADMIAVTVPDLKDTSQYPPREAVAGWTLVGRKWQTRLVESIEAYVLPPGESATQTPFERVSLERAKRGQSETRSVGLVAASGRGILFDISRALTKAWIAQRGRVVDGKLGEMLAVQAHGSPQVPVRENWKSASGRVTVCDGYWYAATDSIVLTSDDGQPIHTVAFCDADHAYDASGLSSCAHCHTVACPQCSSLAQPTHQCEVCKRNMCATCRPDHHDCAICGRRACVDCWAEDTCTTCRAPDAITMDKARQIIPQYVVPDGLHVRKGQDSEQTTLVLTGTARRELLQFDADGNLTHWWSLGDSPPVLLTQALGVAAQANIGGNIAIITATVPATPQVVSASQAIVLDTSEGTQMRWDIEDSPVAEGKFSGAVLPQEPTEPRQRQALERLTPPVSGTPRVLTCTTVHTVITTWLDAEGMHARSTIGTDEHDALTQWRIGSQALGRSALTLPAGWPHQPIVRFHASSGNHHGWLMTIGPYRLLLHRSGANDAAKIWDLDGFLKVEKTLATGLALTGEWTEAVVRTRVAELPQAPGVRSRAGDVNVTGRSWIALIDPHSGPLTPSSSWDLGHERPRIPTSVLPTSTVLSQPTAAVRSIAGQLTELLAPPPRTNPLSLVIGARTCFTATIDGTTRSGEYLTLPSDPNGRVTCAETGKQMTAPLLCDQGHLTDTVTACSYCHVWVCDRCPAPAVRCDICELPMCADCSTGHDRCHACRSLQRPGWWTRRRLSRGLHGVESILIGNDALHETRLMLLAETIVRTVTPVRAKGVTTEHQRQGPMLDAFSESR